MFDIKNIIKNSKGIKADSYSRTIESLIKRGLAVKHIETTIETAVDNLKAGKRSFVIYGEPQSGKTEMMISLTARLLDEGYRYIVVLMNDSIVLLDQNLARFKKAGLNTVPVSYKELLDTTVKIESQARVIFSKKNASDLKRLLELTRKIDNLVVIDDEADYATPNSKINKNEISKINELTGNLLKMGIYIGVTATPARLDLNNTHLNEPEYWVDYPTHPNYTGQDVFFPTNMSETSKFKLELLPDDNDDIKYLRNAVLSFLVNSAYLNVSREEHPYTMLIHTSGKKDDHVQDFKDVSAIITSLSDPENKKYVPTYEYLWGLTQSKYPGYEDQVTSFIMAKIESHYLVVMNSDHDPGNSVAGDPPSPFTFIIGGNSISRGVTFSSLITMFFTRDSKHSIQQDTYIQRARMFGARGDILSHFELYIPKQLYAVWRRAFIFHRLSLQSRKNGNGIPVWHEGMRVKVAANNSIDSSSVTFDKGEMSFEKFVFTEEIDRISTSDDSDLTKLSILMGRLPANSLPRYLIDFIQSFSGSDEQAIVIHKPRSVMGMDPKNTSYIDIERSRGLIAGGDLLSNLKPNASHHVFIFYNDRNEARIVYKFNENISFIKGRK